ncbi:hypothetical protein GH722_13640 [Alphaproteobacteria bacterium HT1-32]|nr:hypothetical protein [Alphaproteobacteria bacterium HT1-32]
MGETLYTVQKVARYTGDSPVTQCAAVIATTCSLSDDLPGSLSRRTDMTA